MWSNGSPLSRCPSRVLEEQVEPVLIEHVERVGAPHHPQLGEPDARGWHAVNLRVIEQPELILREAIEVVAAEKGPIQVQLVERVPVEVL